MSQSRHTHLTNLSSSTTGISVLLFYYKLTNHRTKNRLHGFRDNH